MMGLGEEEEREREKGAENVFWPKIYFTKDFR